VYSVDHSIVRMLLIQVGAMTTDELVRLVNRVGAKNVDASPSTSILMPTIMGFEACVPLKSASLEAARGSSMDMDHITHSVALLIIHLRCLSYTSPS